MSWVLGFGVLKACMQISIYKPYTVVGLPDKTTDHPVADSPEDSVTLAQGLPTPAKPDHDRTNRSQSSQVIPIIY